MPTVTHIIDKNLPVYATGDQTISGVKTFVNRPKFNNFDISISGDQFKNYYFETVSVGDNIFIKAGRNVSADIYTYYDTGTVNVFLPSGNNCLIGDELSLSLGGNGAIFDLYSVQQLGPVSSIVKFYTTTEKREFLKFINKLDNGLNWSLLPIENEIKKLINNIVYTTGNQNISGIKNFISKPTINGTGVLLSGEAGDLSSTVRTTGNQQVSGTKTFITNSVLYSGVNVNFDSNTNVRFSGQVSFSNDRSWTTGISLGSSSYTIPYYGGSFSNTPTVLATLEVTGSTVFNYNIKNRTSSQFTLLFSSALTENITLNVRAVL